MGSDSVHLRLQYNTDAQGFTVFQWHMCFYIFEGPYFFRKKGILRRWSLLYAQSCKQGRFAYVHSMHSISQ